MTVQRILVATDRSSSADRAVEWAAEMSTRYEAELVLVQILLPDTGDGTEAAKLSEFATAIGPRVRSRIVVDADPSDAIVRAAADERADVVVVGNVGMSGRKQFLLGNVPNRVSHNAACTVVIVNTSDPPTRRFGRRR